MFTKADFTQEVATRLTVIIMSKMEKKPLTSFFSLEPSQKKKFNRLMNEYIVSLGEEWKDKMEADFNLIVNEDILNESFDPSKLHVKDVTLEPKMLLSPEQEQWIKEETEAGRPPKLV
jgi:hypothetical protein